MSIADNGPDVREVFDLAVELQQVVKGNDLHIVLGAVTGILVTTFSQLHGQDAPEVFEREYVDVLRSLIRHHLNRQQ